MHQSYPDLSGLFGAKKQRRLAMAALSWEEKVAIIEQMRVSLPKGIWHQALTIGDTADPAISSSDVTAQPIPEIGQDERDEITGILLIL